MHEPWYEQCFVARHWPAKEAAVAERAADQQPRGHVHWHREHCTGDSHVQAATRHIQSVFHCSKAQCTTSSIDKETPCIYDQRSKRNPTDAQILQDFLAQRRNDKSSESIVEIAIPALVAHPHALTLRACHRCILPCLWADFLASAVLVIADSAEDDE